MGTPADIIEKIKTGMKKEWKLAFRTAVLIGLLVHMPAMIHDVPNHDGLDSMYFDQNMITSGRWFLTIACGFSSYFSLPWLIGLLSVFVLGVTAAVLTELLELKRSWIILLVSGLLATFPALASTFAYIFTMDGYMVALLLAVLSVLLTKKYRYGFVGGAVCLACSLGTYQSYLPFAILLCTYSVIISLLDNTTVKEKVNKTLHYLYMGVLGGGLYLVILQVLLKIQGKELDTYQGINGMGLGDAAVSTGFFTTLKGMYSDFVRFTLHGNVLFNNIFSGAAFLVLAAVAAVVIITMCFRRKWWKNPAFFVIMVLLVLGLPLVTNVILLISPNVTYHLLMRYQWIVYPIVLLAFCDRYMEESNEMPLMQWGLLCAGAVLVFNYIVTDNIAYSNLQKRYEKTYAYCVRLLDRIEQTEGYYQGIPIAMVGVVGDYEYPLTDITGDVTDEMIGISGDILIYTGKNYKEFMQYYLGATLNILEPEAMAEVYYSEEYIAMDSFPGPESTKVMDGILYVKTENTDRN